jgi:hypothetical protein
VQQFWADFESAPEIFAPWCVFSNDEPSSYALPMNVLTIAETNQEGVIVVTRTDPKQRSTVIPPSALADKVIDVGVVLWIDSLMRWNSCRQGITDKFHSLRIMLEA